MKKVLFAALVCFCFSMTAFADPGSNNGKHKGWLKNSNAGNHYGIPEYQAILEELIATEWNGEFDSYEQIQKTAWYYYKTMYGKKENNKGQKN